MTSTVQRLGIDVRPLSGHTGAEIHGVDLSQQLDDATIAEIRSALLRWKVVFFRDQSIGHAEQIAFGVRFGKITPAHPHEDAPPEGFPQILPIDSRRYEKKFGKRKITYDNGWHTDVTALVNPPAGSILRADIVPPYGGDTAWTNLVAAYQGLPEELRTFADRLRAKHSFSPRLLAGTPYGAKIASNPLVAIHPVVRVHPETGERALFVSPSFTSGENEIIGFSPRQSHRILDLFYEQIARPEYTVRFRWSPGDVAFWDNRATAHLGPSDLGHLDFDRVLYRITLEGDIPVGVDGRQSELVAGQPFLAG
ncbi:MULTISPECIES: TauD/TfdA family dioxygenase [Protofrankia]|uniref:Taurine dioxygenase n=1 Tax=Protofrankia coriariae TaxID=1562887 RepID=A0ABR5F6G2_9ACTN|nr:MULTISPECIES: TauD/TfdA family dioxygenase [Protofrankia]KLL12321.1 taurine dioxygenase [Protofrankia coriariae]ONH37895.1 taurine dioxygenase [Protofrankia sp. BMG5.30]